MSAGRSRGPTAWSVREMLSALIPVAQAPATMEPMLVPARASTGIPSRSKTRRTPRCANPARRAGPEREPNLAAGQVPRQPADLGATWPRRSRRTSGGSPSPANAPSRMARPPAPARRAARTRPWRRPTDGVWARLARTIPVRPPRWAARNNVAASVPEVTSSAPAMIRQWCAPLAQAKSPGLAVARVTAGALQRLERLDLAARPTERAEADAGEGRVRRCGAAMVCDSTLIARDFGQGRQGRRPERRERPAKGGWIDREQGPAEGVQRQAHRQVDRQRRPGGRARMQATATTVVRVALIGGPSALRRSLRTREMFWARRGELPRRARIIVAPQDERLGRADSR